MEWFLAHSAGILRGSMVNADDTTQLIWIKYMAMANEAKDPDSGRLEFAKGQPYPIEYIAMICRKPVEVVLKAEEHFKADLNRDGVTPRVIIESDGTRVLSNWKHYQRRRDGRRQADPAELLPPAPLTNEERKAKQEVAAIELGYKFPDKAQIGIDRKQFDKDQKARLKE